MWDGCESMYESRLRPSEHNSPTCESGIDYLPMLAEVSRTKKSRIRCDIQSSRIGRVNGKVGYLFGRIVSGETLPGPSCVGADVHLLSADIEEGYVAQFRRRTSMHHHGLIWDAFCTRMRVCESGVPLFQHAGDRVLATKVIGVRAQRPVLCRSSQMAHMIRSETDKLIADWKTERDDFDGLIYVMFVKEAGKVIPLYIGKTETIGKGYRNLSANVKNLHRDCSKFARWGDNYAYHIGDLSAAILPGHDPLKVRRKYIRWATSLVVTFPMPKPVLKQEVYFWTIAWRNTTVGIWQDFGPTRLTFLEYLMIGVASSVFPEVLRNSEGQNRG